MRVGPVGREALEAGAARAASLEVGRVPQVKMSGKTDQQIVREILALAHLAEERIETLLPDALAEVERFLAAAEERVRQDGVVLPGVLDLLERLDKEPGVRQTLLTGNLAANAALKTAAFGLDRLLDLEIGAYGSDHADRRALVPIALQRARSLRREDYRRDEVWVVGDTPHDLAAARAGGVRCLLVGTGSEDFGPLQEAGADAAVEDLSDTEAVVSLLVGA